MPKRTGTITAHVEYAELTGNHNTRAGTTKYFADVKVSTNVELPAQTAIEVGWATLARHDGRERFVLEGLLPRATVHEIKPAWSRGQSEYIVQYRDNNGL